MPLEQILALYTLLFLMLYPQGTPFLVKPDCLAALARFKAVGSWLYCDTHARTYVRKYAQPKDLAKEPGRHGIPRCNGEIQCFSVLRLFSHAHAHARARARLPIDGA